ncbi:DUF4168 domain-containing protein [Lyngbya confervoides]|uniref:DUF4168 domain-containing protein n=1 Tax=Lyngbya confervoides TaxID=207921 RepID=UPI00140CA64E
MTRALNTSHHQNSPLKPWIKALLISSFSLSGLLSGVIPSLSFSRHQTQLTFSQQAYAQSFTNDIVWRYAAAVLEIDPIREQLLDEVKRIMGSSKPPQVCNQSNLPSSVESICDRYKSQSANILNKYQVLGVYNSITSRIQTDSNLRNRIITAMKCQQQGLSFPSCF